MSQKGSIEVNELEGKNAIVTGGTRGIGLAITRALLERGASVFICARKKEEVERDNKGACSRVWRKNQGRGIGRWGL